jgi:hypothetical protein
MKGAAFIAGGCVLVIVYAGWFLDLRGVSRSLYSAFIRSWRRIPAVGESWIKTNPYQAYRWKVFISGALFGTFLIAIGIRLIVG